MNLNDSICKFIEGAQDKSEGEQKTEIEKHPAKADSQSSVYKLNPRDGMSLESAKLAIGRCG